MKLRVTRKSITITVDGKEITKNKGDEFEGTARMLLAFRDRLEAVSGKATLKDAGADEADRAALLAKAKELGITGAANMKLAKLQAAVEAKEAELAAAKLAELAAAKLAELEAMTDEELTELAVVAGLTEEQMATREDLIAALTGGQDGAQ